MRAAFDVLEVLFMLAEVDLLRDAAANHIYLSIIFVYLLLFVYLFIIFIFFIAVHSAFTLQTGSHNIAAKLT